MNKPISRQRRWQLKKLANGQCEICGNTRIHFATLCDYCGVKRRKCVRKAKGFSSNADRGPGPKHLVPDN